MKNTSLKIGLFCDLYLILFTASGIVFKNHPRFNSYYLAGLTITGWIANNILKPDLDRLSVGRQNHIDHQNTYYQADPNIELENISGYYKNFTRNSKVASITQIAYSVFALAYLFYGSPLEEEEPYETAIKVHAINALLTGVKVILLKKHLSDIECVTDGNNEMLMSR